MNRTAIVTGGSRGLGRALAAGLVGQGWVVVIDARDAVALEEAAAATGAIALAGDVRQPDHRRLLLEVATRGSGRLDLLVNNAGELGPSPLPALGLLDPDAYRRVLDSNVVAPLALIQEALPALRTAGGAIVQITSDAAVEAYPGWGAYGSSKAALEQLSAVLAAEEEALRVWWFDPGDMRTEMHQAAFPGEDISDRPEPATVVPAVLRLIGSDAPSGRYRAADLLADPLGSRR